MSPATHPARIIGYIFLPIGIVLLGVAVWLAEQRREILNTWPEAQAEVTYSELTYSRSRSGSSMYSAEYVFRYTVNGREYTARDGPGYSTSSYSSMEEKVQRYAPGTRHPIHYNPQNPQEIRIEVGYNLSTFGIPLMVAAMGLVFAGLGLGVVRGGGRSRYTDLVRCPACGKQTLARHPACIRCGAALPPTAEVPESQ
ncbi:MAG: DUF3592 domain-containing protein [Terriglobales bacterium]